MRDRTIVWQDNLQRCLRAVQFLENGDLVALTASVNPKEWRQTRLYACPLRADAVEKVGNERSEAHV
jgi:hypothetical protein